MSLRPDVREFHHSKSFIQEDRDHRLKLDRTLSTPPILIVTPPIFHKKFSDMEVFEEKSKRSHWRTRSAMQSWTNVERNLRELLDAGQ